MEFNSIPRLALVTFVSAALMSACASGPQSTNHEAANREVAQAGGHGGAVGDNGKPTSVSGKVAIEALENYITVLQHSGNGCSVWVTFSDKQLPSEYAQPQASDLQNPWTNISVNNGPTFALASYNDAVLTESKNSITVSMRVVETGSDAGHREQATITGTVTINKATKTVTVSTNHGKPMSCTVNDLNTSEDPHANDGPGPHFGG